MDTGMSKMCNLYLGIGLVLLDFLTLGSAEEAIPCISYKNNYFDFLNCTDAEFCCGKVPQQKCCPKVSLGAIFGIVLSAVVFCAIMGCSVVACCRWCYCCPHRRSRLMSCSSEEPGPSEIESPSDKRGKGHPLTLRIDTSRGIADTDLSPPTDNDVFPGTSGPRLSLNMNTFSLPTEPETPETPMSVSSPTEFSKLITHDWTRQRQRDETSPYTDTVEPETS